MTQPEGNTWWTYDDGTGSRYIRHIDNLIEERLLATKPESVRVRNGANFSAVVIQLNQQHKITLYVRAGETDNNGDSQLFIETECNVCQTNCTCISIK